MANLNFTEAEYNEIWSNLFNMFVYSNKKYTDSDFYNTLIECCNAEYEDWKREMFNEFIETVAKLVKANYKTKDVILLAIETQKSDKAPDTVRQFLKDYLNQKPLDELAAKRIFLDEYVTADRLPAILESVFNEE